MVRFGGNTNQALDPNANHSLPRAPLELRIMTAPATPPTESFVLTMTSDELDLVISSLCLRLRDLERLASVDPRRGPELPPMFGPESRDELVSTWRGAAATCRGLVTRLREQQIRQGSRL
jgi:hypothetical protein